MDINPNRSVEQIFRKPKSRFMRRVLARYVVWVETVGYLFMAAMIAALAYLSFYKTEVSTVPVNAANDKLVVAPMAMDIPAPAAGKVALALAAKGGKVAKGQPLFAFQRDSGGLDTLRAPCDGMLLAKKGGFAFDAAALAAGRKAGEALAEVVDFGRLVAAMKFEEAGKFQRIAKGSPVQVELKIKSPSLAFLDVDAPEGHEAVGLSPLADTLARGTLEAAKKALNGMEITGRDNETQYGKFAVTAVTGLEIRGEFAARRADAAASVPADPLSGRTLTGAVDSGAYVLEAELTRAVPAAFVRAVKDSLARYSGRAVRGPKGAYALDAIRGATVKASVTARLPLGGQVLREDGIPEGLQNSAINKKYFEGRAVFADVPGEVQDALRAAYEKGETVVTASAKCVIDHQSWAARLFSRK